HVTSKMPMKILLVHNHYQVAGGEDTVVCAEKSMLESHGHSVAMLEVSNVEIGGAIGKAAVAARSVYSLAGKRLARQELDRFRPGQIRGVRTAGGQSRGQAELRSPSATAGVRAGRICAVRGKAVARERYRDAAGGVGKIERENSAEDCGRWAGARPGYRGDSV